MFLRYLKKNYLKVDYVKKKSSFNKYTLLKNNLYTLYRNKVRTFTFKSNKNIKDYK